MLPLGQASGMAFCSIVSCGESRNIPINGNAETDGSEKTKVSFVANFVFIPYHLLLSLIAAAI